MDPVPAPDRPFLAGLLPPELARILAALGAERYRTDQVFEAVHRHGALGVDALRALPAALRLRLEEVVTPEATRVLEAKEAADGTTKLLVELTDRRRVESVWIPEGRRRTVCVSTQVGCPIGCVFCASGVGGLVRNLAVAEIVEQPLRFVDARGERPTHVVVMGMGEPLLNLEALGRAVALWRDPRGLGLSPRRITISTASTGALVDRLREADLGTNLAVSLHGPDDETRGRLVPTSRPGRTEELVEAATRYARATGRDATIEYVLIEGENDRAEHAETLGRLLRGRHLHVNLIPLNQVRHRPDLRPPSGLAARGFLGRLRARHVSATLRTRRGDEISAACGQLALEAALGGAPAPDTPPRRR